MTATKESLLAFANKLNHLSRINSPRGGVLPGIVVEGPTDIQYLQALLCEQVVVEYAGDKPETLRWGQELQSLVTNRPVFTIVDADFERLEPPAAGNPSYVARCDHHDIETMFYSCGYADLQREKLQLDVYRERVWSLVRDLVHEAGWALYANLQLGEDFSFDDVCFDVECQFLMGMVLSPVEALYDHLRRNGSAWHSDEQISKLRLHVDAIKRKLGELVGVQSGFNWDLAVGHHVQDAIAAMGECLLAPTTEGDSTWYAGRARSARDVSHHLRSLIKDDVDMPHGDEARLNALRKLDLVEQLSAWEMNGKYRLLKCGLAVVERGQVRDCRRCRVRGV